MNIFTVQQNKLRYQSLLFIWTGETILKVRNAKYTTNKLNYFLLVFTERFMENKLKGLRAFFFLFNLFDSDHSK